MLLEILILAAVALWLGFTVFYLIRRKKRGCTGCCEGCEMQCKKK